MRSPNGASGITIPRSNGIYWITLTTKVPPEQGLPHFRNVHIWDIKATGAKQAFNVSAYPNAPLVDFRLDHLAIEAQTAGTIANTKDWQFADNTIKTADGTKPRLTNGGSGDQDVPFGEPKGRP